MSEFAVARAEPEFEGFYCEVSAFQAARDVTVLSECEVSDHGKMNVQLKANEENQDRAQCGKDEPGGMISAVCRARQQVGNGAADDRSDDAQHDRPEDRYMLVHHRFRDNPRD